MRRITLITNPDKCNKKCPLCFRNQRDGFTSCGEMPIELAKKSIRKYALERDSAGNRLLKEVIPSTMGEPLLYSHFQELLDFCAFMNLPMNITTNGTFPGIWNTLEGMEMLLNNSNDIKLSCMEFDDESWKKNVERFVALANKIKKATVSLQVTLHKEISSYVLQIMEWAQLIGISRIKWNKVVFLKCASKELKERFELTENEYVDLKMLLQSNSLKCEGSLFFFNNLCNVGGKCGAECPFSDEIWVFPDGSEDHCPNPEIRWGRHDAR